MLQNFAKVRATLSRVLAVSALAFVALPYLSAQDDLKASAELFSAQTATDGVQQYIDATNDALKLQGADHRIAMAQIMVRDLDPNTLTTVYASDHTLRLRPLRWVQGDPRRGGRTYLSYANWWIGMGTISAAHTLIDVEPSVDAAIATWNAVQCSHLALVKQTLPPRTVPSLIFRFRDRQGFWANNPYAVDLSVIGWLPSRLFTPIFGNLTPGVLGVTFTWVWVDPATEVPTDIDGDHWFDMARTETWFHESIPYNITWSNDQTTNFDTEGFDAQYVSDHELGHAIGLGHFGRIAVVNGKTVVSPVAIMNAQAVQSIREPQGTDIAGVCADYSQWSPPQ